MFQLSNQWILFVVDISCKALLLTVAAGIILRAMRVRDASICHRAWLGVLSGMLLVPALTLMMPPILVPLPLGASPVPSNSEMERQSDTAQPPTGANTVASRNENSQLELNSDTDYSVAAGEQEQSAERGATETTTAKSSIQTAAGARSVPQLSLSSWLFIAWSLVAGTFLLRLLFGLALSASLIRRAREISTLELKTAGGAATASWPLIRADIRESKEISVPVTVGCWRPTILLPTEWKEWSGSKLLSIITHEVTHVARRDFIVAVMADINRCIYWFHPVAWWLRSRLSDLAEEACDDAAIGQTGDRSGYARYLLEVAASLTSARSRLIEPGLSMARESNVETRIATILDSSRPISRRLTWKTAALIACVAMPLITSAAAIRPVSPTDNESNEAQADGEKVESVHIRGQVVDSAGKPLPQAVLQLWHAERADWYAAPDAMHLVADISVSANGRFDQRIARDKLPLKETSNGLDYLDYNHQLFLVATSPGQALIAMRGNPAIPVIDGKPVEYPNFLTDSVKIQLEPAVSIQGRVLSIEGQPVAGAKISIYQKVRTDHARLEEWLGQTESSPQSAAARERTMMMGGPVERGVFYPALSMLPVSDEIRRPVVTDDEGRFELHDLLAQDDLAVLRISGDRIVNTTAHVLAREMKPVYGRQTTRFTHTGAYYGSVFDFVAQPSVPVYGIVRDVESGEPLKNVPVAVGAYYGVIMSHTGYTVVQTDAEGRYRIDGMPIPPPGTGRYKRNRLAVRPTGLPYIENDNIHVPRGNGTDSLEFNIEMRRAVMATGRITDKSTGEAVAGAELYYAPYKENENCKDYLRYADGTTTMLGNHTRYYSNDNGEFEIPVIPGRGVIGARIRSGGYIPAFGAKNIEAFEDIRGGLSALLSDHIVPNNYHSLLEIDVPEGAEQFPFELHVDQGHSLTVHFVDPQGKSLSNVGCSGLSSDRRYRFIKDDHAEASGLAIGEVRAMYLHSKDESLARLIRLIPEEGQTDFEVTLYPNSRFTGRMVDPEGRPVEGVLLEARYQYDPNISGSRPGVKTDADGRFEYLLPVGAKYSIVVRSEKFFRLIEDMQNDKPQLIDVGDVVLDTDAERWTTLKTKREPEFSELPFEPDNRPADAE